MPYARVAQLPESVKCSLPNHAKAIYKEAFNNAWREYKDPASRRDNVSREEISHRVAWSTVKEKYEKDDSGLWVPKS